MATVAISIVLLAATTALAQDSDAVGQLAPGRKLRVGAYPGSPLNMVILPSGERHGLVVDLGRELAQRISATFELVQFKRIEEVIDAMAAGQVDFAVSNASPKRAKVVDFTPDLLLLELGYLVPAGSPITSIDQIDKAGARVGVTRGSTSEQTLPKLIRRARRICYQ